MDNRVVTGIVIVLLIGLGIWYFADRAPAEPGSTAGEQNASTSPLTTRPDVEVIYSDSGFSPRTVTVTPGQKVVWVNESSKDMWIASAQHPTHAVYNGTTRTEHCADSEPVADTVFDQCIGVGLDDEYSFTFSKTGTWNYHDHLTPTFFGSVIVASSTGS